MHSQIKPKSIDQIQHSLVCRKSRVGENVWARNVKRTETTEGRPADMVLPHGLKRKKEDTLGMSPLTC